MIARLLACSLGATLALSPVAAAAGVGIEATGPSDVRPADWRERVDHGLELAKISQPEELVMSTALKELDQGLVKALRADPDFRELDAEFPGFLERYYAAARPELEKALRARLPELWQSMAEAYAGEMTVSEIDAQARFLQGPTGRRVQQLATDNFDGSRLVESSVSAGSAGDDVSDAGGKELAAATGMALLSSLSMLSDADRTEFVAYTASPPGKAAQRAGKRVMAAIVAWMNAPDPAAEAKMGEIALSVLTEMQKAKATGR